jgi:hypothetical protein
MKRGSLTPFSFAFALLLCFIASTVAKQQELKWAGDPEGGAPFVEADPADPNKVTGFDVEIAELIAKGVNRARHGANRVERNGRHARAPCGDGDNDSVLRLPGGARGAGR